MSSTVLITTANQPPNGVPFLEMTDAAIRCVTAKASVFFWAAQGIEKIVIADATGGTLLDSSEVLLLKQINVDVEQISYYQDEQQLRLKGKGYGEGELLSFALENSITLGTVDRFFKCTGKVYCRNFEAIINMVNHNKLQSIFWRHLGEGGSLQQWADIRFYYTTKEFCHDSLIPAYQKANDSKAAAEYYVFHLLNEKLIAGKAPRPLLSGFEGGTGKQYFDSSLGVLDENCPCWVST